MKLCVSMGIVVAAAGCVAAMAAEEEPSVSAKTMVGSWSCVSATIDGSPLAPETASQLRLNVTADRYRTERGDQVLFDSTYSVAANKTPHEIDMVGTEGELKGKVAPGIFRIEGDTLTMCYVMPGKDRPAAFESQPKSGAFLVVWKRAKKE